jgi:hypothetical protein
MTKNTDLGKRSLQYDIKALSYDGKSVNLSASFCHKLPILLIDWHIPILFGLLDPQDKGTMILKNAGKYLPSNTATAQKT